MYEDKMKRVRMEEEKVLGKLAHSDAQVWL